MKKLILAITLILVLAPYSFAAQTGTVVAKWNSNPPSEEVTKYIVRYLRMSDNLMLTVDVPHVEGLKKQSVEIPDLTGGDEYGFVLIACDAAGNCSQPTEPIIKRLSFPPTMVDGVEIVIRLDISIVIP